MSKLIGTNPNQVPSNADLGSAAFVDVKELLTAKGSSLSAIHSVMPNTANAVFVYDTSNDSDGGAWRKRTQDTSWYKEQLDTQIRGSKREFPAVAVIVAEDDTLRIHDGDDPTLPMWMEFRAASGNGSAMAGRDLETTIAVHMLNGSLCLGRTSFGLHVINFIGDYAQFIENGWDTTYGYPIGTHRNANNYWESPSNQGNDLVNDLVTSLDMRVMRGAPINSRSGLPQPTIAVGTGTSSGGVTIIRDDGISVDLTTGTYGVGHVKFITDHIMNIGVRNIGTGGASLYSANVIVPTSDKSLGTGQAYNETITSGSAGGYLIGNSHRAVLSAGGVHSNAIMKNYEPNFNQEAMGFLAASTGTGGLGIFERDNSELGIPSLTENRHRVHACVISTESNSGWLPGDQRLCVLADTEAGIMTQYGENIFAGKGWTNNGSFPYETFTTSGLNITSAINTTAYGAANTTWTPTVGKTYSARFTLTLNSGTAPRCYVESSSSWGNGRYIETKAGLNFITFTAQTGVSSYFNFSTESGVATNFSVANLEVWEGGSPDRGDDRHEIRWGMSAVGTLTRKPVATGAELVAYEGFSSSNYLQQPYSSKMDFGTGDFYISGWFDTCSDGRVIVERIGIDQDGTTNGATDLSGRLYIYTASGKIYVTFGTQSWNTGIYTAGSAWKQLVFMRKGGTVTSYINGKLHHTEHNVTGSLGATDHYLRIGTGFPYRVSPCTGRLALWKFSATSVSDDQIKRWYMDERKMFLPGAKCTLYGSDNNVQSVAYDRGTDLLHAGTSSGRSVFSGITRIDNTTSAVDTGISAVNGTIVEIDQ